MTKIKICGLTRPCDIAAVNASKPDYIGFVFAESRRRVTAEQAAELKRQLSPGIMAVGVFVDEKPEKIAALVQSGVIGMIQLHGAEDDEYIERLKRLTARDSNVGYAAHGVPIIKANAHSQAADYLLFDSPTPGSGKVFDWDTLGKTTKPFFLAGGLNAENVAEAIQKTAPFAVDTSSGVETNGLKDERKIETFIRRIRDE